MKKNNSKTENLLPIVLIIVFVLFAIFAPLLFTGNLGIKSNYDFSKTGGIGNTIDGLTAPFIGILGAILVYISFRQQVKANERQIDSNNLLKKNTKKEYFFNLYKEIDATLQMSYQQYCVYSSKCGLTEKEKKEVKKEVFNILTFNQKKNSASKYCEAALKLFDITIRSFQILNSWNEARFKNILVIKIQNCYELYFKSIIEEMIQFLNEDNELKKLNLSDDDKKEFFNLFKPNNEERKQEENKTTKLETFLLDRNITISEKTQNHFNDIQNSFTIKLIYGIENTMKEIKPSLN
jgi:hypothetical protein